MWILGTTWLERHSLRQRFCSVRIEWCPHSELLSKHHMLSMRSLFNNILSYLCLSVPLACLKYYSSKKKVL